MTTRLLRASLGSPTYDGMRQTLRTALHTPSSNGAASP